MLHRAQRSLARNAIRRSDWAATARHWEAALALNPLNPEGWFSLGYAYIKLKDSAKALQVSLAYSSSSSSTSIFLQLGYAYIILKDFAKHCFCYILNPQQQEKKILSLFYK